VRPASPAIPSKSGTCWLHVYYKKIPDGDDDYTMDQTASVFLLDRDGHSKGTIANGEDTGTAIAKLERLIE